MYKILVFLLVTGLSWSSDIQAQSKRVANLEVHIASPLDGQEIVGLKTIIKIEAENHGPDDLSAGDTVVIHFPGSETYVRYLDRDLKKGERLKVFDELINAPQYGTFNLTAYLVEDLTKVAYQGKPLADTWIDPDSTNNIKTVQFSLVEKATDIQRNKVESRMNVYPNPAHAELHIQFEEKLNGNHMLMIYDVSGKIVRKEDLKIEGDRWIVSVEGLPLGMYTLAIVHPQRLISFTSKFIKK